MFCRKCGSELPEGAVFCGKCGTPVNVDGAQTGTPPAQTPTIPVVVTPTATPVASKSSKRNIILIAVAACLAIGVGVAAFVAFGPRGAGGGAVGVNGDTVSVNAVTPSVTVKGTTVQAMLRPTLGSTVQSSTGVSAAPALAVYKTAGDGTSSDATSGDNTSSQTTSGSTDNSGGSSGGSDSGSNNTGGSSSTGGSGDNGTSGATVQNPYGTLTELTPASDLSNVTNIGDFKLTDQQKSLLEQNMFAVDTTQNQCEFFDIYEANRYAVLPSFVTTDSMMHTYHLYFSHLLKNTEKNYLSGDLNSLSQSMLQASTDQLNTLTGTEWEAAATRNVTYFAIACRLLDPNAQIPASVETTVNDEVAKIEAASGIQQSELMGDQEDYSQYKPRGYYEGDEQLERYFRAMMWYGQINFTQKDEDLDRSALLITLALDGGTGGTVDSNWESIYTVTSFFAGASDDMSYYEYYPLFTYSYGDGATIADLAGNTDAWNTYHGLTAEMPAPKISSTVVGDEAESTDADIKGFRFMGQRFTIDEGIFQQLVYDNVGTSEQPRMLPAALDLPAALGSDEALSILSTEGETSYANYDTQMQAQRTQIANSDDTIWTASLYSQWLYTLNPMLASKGEGYPSFMQSTAWDDKNLQSYLGSYTELKHDTVLYSKQVMVEMGGGNVPQNDDRGYVEPEPEVYARLANLTQATSDGLSKYGMLSSDDADNLAILQQLSTQLQTISEKELAGEEPTSDEYDLIRTYGGQLEHFWTAVNNPEAKSSNRSAQYPAAVVVDVATDGTDGTTLELGTGKVSTIYVLVPIGGELHLCKGATYTYYDFEQPISDRLTDSEWRTMLGITGSSGSKTTLPDQPDWTSGFEVQ